MDDLTNILQAVEQGQLQANDQLFQIVYNELRRMAQRQLAQEQPGQTLQPTALVHEAWLRLVKSPQDASPSPLTPLPPGERGTSTPTPPATLPGGERGDRRRYFFAAAGEAMRRILVEKARRKKAEIHGGKAQRVELDPEQMVTAKRNDDLLLVHEALDRLHEHDASVAELVKLRYFVGMTIPEVAQALDISPRTADAWWAYARAWLREALGEEK